MLREVKGMTIDEARKTMNSMNEYEGMLDKLSYIDTNYAVHVNTSDASAIKDKEALNAAI